MRPRSFLLSTALQTLGVALLFLTSSSPVVQKTVKQVTTLVMPADLAPLSPPKPTHSQGGGGGGGGDHSPLPASKGRLPKAALRQFVPPAVVLHNDAPKLAMEPSILMPPDI